jgi:hypothetical protein
MSHAHAFAFKIKDFYKDIFSHAHGFIIKIE